MTHFTFVHILAYYHTWVISSATQCLSPLAWYPLHILILYINKNKNSYKEWIIIFFLIQYLKKIFRAFPEFDSLIPLAFTSKLLSFETRSKSLPRWLSRSQTARSIGTLTCYYAVTPCVTFPKTPSINHNFGAGQCVLLADRRILSNLAVKLDFYHYILTSETQRLSFWKRVLIYLGAPPLWFGWGQSQSNCPSKPVPVPEPKTS